MLVREVVQKLDALYPPMQGAPRIAEYMAEMTRMLRIYEGDILENAYEVVMGEWTDRWRPLPAEFAKHCRQNARATDQDRALLHKQLKEATEFRDKEFRTFMDNTLRHYADDIAQGSALYEDVIDGRTGEATNPYRASVVAYVEIKGRTSEWFRRLKGAPYAHEITEFDWGRIKDIADISAPIMRSRDTKKLLANVTNSLRVGSLDGYQPEA